MADIPEPERELSPEREPEREPSPERPKAKKRGRPPGAKNKPKPEALAPPPAEEAKPKRRRQVIVVESSSSSEEEIVVKRKRRPAPEVAREETRSLAPSDHTTLDDIAQSLHSAHLQRAIAQKMTYDGYFSRLK